MVAISAPVLGVAAAIAQADGVVDEIGGAGEESGAIAGSDQVAQGV